VRARWVAALAQALQEAPDALHWVLSLREDFAAELHEWSTQVPGLFDHTLRLQPLSREEAREAIVRPLARVGAEIAAALVERVLDDLLSQRELDDLTQQGVPPAPLQIVCDRLYSARDAAGRITSATYEALGGARRILADYVDIALAQLPRARRETAVALLKAMVTGRETKLPLRPAEILNQVAGDATEKQAVLMELVNARLVRSLQVGDERRYELMHDVLVGKIRSWIGETEQAAQTARDLLRQGRSAWQELRALPEREKVTYLHAQRENPYLHLSREDAALMARAALHEGLAPGYWVRRAVELDVAPWPLLAPLLESTRERERIHALWGLTGWDAPQAWERLRAGMADDAPRVRVAAHQALYHLGTPQALALLDESDDLRLVPAGEFTMGSDQQNDEKPIHQVTLDPFFAEKYPVTNARYARFIEAGGYENEQWWTRAGWQWARRTGRTQPAFWDDEKWNRLQYPVVGITWYEAWAYAHWAGRRLLTEAEWEKAVRGTDGRAYPWGNEFDGEKCNVGTGKILDTSGATTPVGQYSPAGDSPYGCADMAGNVWEWTSSLYRPYPYQADDGREDVEAQGDRVVRGGSWNDDPTYARCAYRPHDAPDFVLSNLGCRCGGGGGGGSFLSHL
jgi:formylglycine-generating enzyme required for sulfatase activity